MKATKLYSILFILLLAPAFLMATNPTEPKSKHTKEKTIKKSFSVNSDATLKVDNSYGNLNIITWNENKIDIEVTITTDGNNLDKVQQKLDEITVDFKASPSLVFAKTIFNKNKSNSWWNWNGNNKVNMKINYVVKMPVSNSVDLSNDYGNINLDKLEGNANISCDYGKIITKELMGESNRLNFDYTSGCYFDYINNGYINADYSGFTVSKSKNLKINADYTNSEVEAVESIEYNCDYGNMKIKKANNIKGSGDYLNVMIGEVYQNVKIDADYGSIKIEEMTAGAKNLEIDGEYTGIKVGYNANYQFQFDIDLEYASLSGGDDFTFTSKEKDGSDKKYVGHYGGQSSGNYVKISSDYGGVTMHKK